jgi:precorrin-2 dehydrogenase/sirohydrochlorin ferrochelatase
MKRYPLFLDLEGKTCLVVGGGHVAERKIRYLLDCAALIKVVAPEYSQSIDEWVREGRIILIPRNFESQDTRGAHLIFAATNHPQINLQIHALASPTQWINVADRPDLSNFFVPAMIQRGEIQVAISTSGNSPGLAKKLKAELEQLIGPEYAQYADFLGEFRSEILQKPWPKEVQRDLLRQLLDDRFFQYTQQGNLDVRNDQVRKLIQSVDQMYPATSTDANL